MRDKEHFDPSVYTDRLISGIFLTSDAEGLPPRKQFYTKVQDKLLAVESKVVAEGATSLLHVFATRIQEGSNVKRLGREFGLPENIVKRVLTVSGIPTPDHAQAVANVWANPEYREKMAKQASEILTSRWEDEDQRALMVAASGQRMAEQWQNDDFRARNIEKSRETMARLKQDPEFQRKQTEASGAELKKRWEDPNYRTVMAEIHSQTLRTLWQDEGYRARKAIQSRETLARQKQDPDFMAKNAEGHRKLWRNEEYRRRVAAAINQARNNPDLAANYYLPTAKGFRPDIGFEAFSAWEANFARILTFTGREHYARQSLSLQVPEEQRELFNGQPETTLDIDFVTLNRRGEMVLYEIMASPLKGDIGWAKWEMAIDQHPNLDFRAITAPLYYRLQRQFADRIDNDDRFIGWERDGHNIRTHPEVFGLPENNQPSEE